MHAHVGAFAGGEQALNAAPSLLPGYIPRPALNVRLDAAHDVVVAGLNRHGGFKDICAGVIARQLIDLRELGHDQISAQVAQVQEDAAVYAPARPYPSSHERHYF